MSADVDTESDFKSSLPPDRQLVMTLFSGSLCPQCHRVRITLAEKEIAFKTVPVDGSSGAGDLSEINPYNSVPTLVDRDIVIYDSRTILDYLEERFPHPPLMPIDPMRRARLRLGMYHIETDWYPQLKKAQSANRKVADKAKKVLEEELLSQVSIFRSKPLFPERRIQLARLQHRLDSVAASESRRLDIAAASETGMEIRQARVRAPVVFA